MVRISGGLQDVQELAAEILERVVLVHRELRVVSVRQNPAPGKVFLQEVSQPHGARFLAHPRAEGIAIQPRDCHDAMKHTYLSVTSGQLWWDFSLHGYLASTGRLVQRSQPVEVPIDAHDRAVAERQLHLGLRRPVALYTFQDHWRAREELDNSCAALVARVARGNQFAAKVQLVGVVAPSRATDRVSE